MSEQFTLKMRIVIFGKTNRLTRRGTSAIP
nr:MAG TPA: hypothetical protein [Caudoviricetes sp.]